MVRFFYRAIRALWLRLTPNPYSDADNYWHKKHDKDDVNGGGNDKDRD